MSHMAGASNKPFDYMAAGLALLVSDLPDWTRMFVDPGFARAVDPTSADSLIAALRWFIRPSGGAPGMAGRARAKIEAEWNYETVFAPILEGIVRCLIGGMGLSFARLFVRAIPDTPW